MTSNYLFKLFFSVYQNMIFTHERLQELCNAFMAGQLTDEEEFALQRYIPEELGEWYRELSKSFKEEGILTSKYTEDQLDELHDNFNTGSLTPRQLEILQKHFSFFLDKWKMESLSQAA